MRTYPLVPLGDFMATRNETIDPANHPEEMFALYSVPAFDSGTPELTPGAQIGSRKQVIQVGDVLLSKIVPHIRRAWDVKPHENSRLIASSEWIVFRSPKIYAPFLRNLLIGDRFHAEFMNTVAGVGGSLLRARPSFVADIAIPLPPLDEQRRIAEVLDRADALRAQRREAIARLDELTQSLFLDMFGTPPESWEISTLGDLGEVQGGLQITRKREELPLSVSYLRVANVYRNRLDLNEIKTIQVSSRELDRTRLQSGDLLVVEGHGNANEIGRAATWDGSIVPCTHQNHLIRVRLDDTKINSRYAAAYINSPIGRRHLLKSAGTTSGLHTISTSDVRATPMLLPPMPLQKRYDEAINAIGLRVQQNESHLEQLDDLFASLQQRAFRGEL